MNRPYTICYLNVSAEAHIDGDFGKLEEAKTATAVFRRRWLEMEADATIYGAATMALFTKGRLTEPLPPAEAPIPRKDWISPVKAAKYYVAINTSGNLAYDGGIVDVKGRGPHGVIHVLTENIGDDYLAYLRRQGVSYIFCGKDSLDPTVMCHKLYSIFGVKKAIISGGAYADWTLLSHGLIDEIKTMFVPVVDGDPPSHTLFLRSEGMESKPVALRLISAEVTEGDGLMVTYAPKNALPND